MKKTNDFTNVVFILDMSGSMDEMRKDVIGGYNSLLSDLSKLETDVKITTVTFNTDYHLVHDKVSVLCVDKLTEDTYTPTGCTALLDAIGKTLDRLDEDYKEERPKKTIIYITTDGLENSSEEYSYKLINKMIKYYEDKEGFDINFLASGINVKEEAHRLGFKNHKAKECDMTSAYGISEMFKCCSEELIKKSK